MLPILPPTFWLGNTFQQIHLPVVWQDDPWQRTDTTLHAHGRDGDGHDETIHEKWQHTSTYFMFKISQHLHSLY